MAVTQTGAMYKALTFDNTSSRTYGVYITGQAVYNAPEREVEMVSIPGRNGAFALDHGRFENIEVTYPAGIFASSETDFADAVSNFRNFLCSKQGYCRLADEYNPNEYRMAVYKSGLEVEPAMLTAGEFNITFECKPQRFLTSGETKSSVANNGTLSNPTLFPSSPLIETKGYGTITIGGASIEVKNETYGQLLLANKGDGDSYTVPLNENNLALMNTGNQISVASGSKIIFGAYLVRQKTSDKTTSVTASVTSSLQASVSVVNNVPQVTIGTIDFLLGTNSTQTVTLSQTINYVYNNTSKSWTGTIPLTITYSASNKTISYYPGTPSPSLPSELAKYFDMNNSYLQDVFGYSTKSLATGTIYLDCDLGEAYVLQNNTPASVNNIVSFPAELPTIPPGASTVTYSNTLTNLKITPRWWKV